MRILLQVPTRSSSGDSLRTKLLLQPILKIVFLLLFFTNSAIIGAEENGRSPRMRLQLKTSSFGVGNVVPTPQSGALAWHNDGFVEPFLFELGAIRSLNCYQAIEQLVQESDEVFIAETRYNEAFVGRLKTLDEQSVVIQSDIYGEITIARNDVLSLIRVEKSGDIIYAGLVDSKVWTPAPNRREIGNESTKTKIGPRNVGQANKADAVRASEQASLPWEIKGGRLIGRQQRAAIVGEVGLPEKCEVTFSLSWKGIPDFVIRLGADSVYHSKAPVPAAARIEVWNRNVVLVRETEHNADLVRLLELTEYDFQLTLRIFLDQQSGLVVVQDVYGRRLGQVSLASDKPQLRSAVHIGNHGPGLNVDRFEVRTWDGAAHIGAGSNQDVRLVGGQNYQGVVVSMNPDTRMLAIRSVQGGIEQVPVRDVAFARLSDPSKSPDVSLSPLDQTADSSEGQSPIDPQMEVVLADRTRLVGPWLASDSQRLGVHSRTLDKDIFFAPRYLAGLSGLATKFTQPRAENRSGLLTAGDSELSGFLANTDGGHIRQDHGESNGNAQAPLRNALLWNPYGSFTASPLAEDAAGAIVYTSRQGAANSSDPLLSASPSRERPIHFRSGETVYGVVERIDQTGVQFQSSETQLRKVELSQMDNLWIGAMESLAKQPTAEKIERLKIIPRAMKNDPPTHLVVSTSGDILRCRLVEMDDQVALVEVSREQQRIPRQQVAQIIWLHDRDWPSDREQRIAELSSKNPGLAANEIFVLYQDRGVTLVPHSVRGGALTGHSDLLGECTVPLVQVRQILFGPDLSTRVGEARENPWVLSLAQSPKAFADQPSDPSDDTASSIVGKNAPAFALPGLGGRTVQLNDYLGRLVVLEFWTSWDGDSVKNVQAVRELMDGLDAAQVTWVAINVQESESKATSAAAKLNILDVAALDKDGSVAADYQATTIPCTIVINPKGKVQKILVDRGNRMTTELRAALEVASREASH